MRHFGNPAQAAGGKCRAVMMPARPRYYSSVLASALLSAAFFPHLAQAACSASGTLAPGTSVTCTGTQTGRVGQGPGADDATVNVEDGAAIAVTDDNSISLGDGANITLGSDGPAPGGSAANAPVVVRTTTDGAAGNGQYDDGDNTIDIGSNSTITINRNASVVAAGTQAIAEAINPYGSGNLILNYGLIQGGAGDAIFFQNVNTTAASPVNIVDNYGVIAAMPTPQSQGGTEPNVLGSNGAVGINFINETGASVVGNLLFQDGNDNLTLDAGSTISGNVDGGGGVNAMVLNSTAGSSDTYAGTIDDFETLTKTGAGTWTLTGAVGDNTAAGSAPLALSVVGGTLVLTGDNAAFNGTAVINPGASPAVAGPDPSATLEARAQSLPPVITDQGVLLVNQVSPDGVQPNDGAYAGLIQGVGVVTKIGVGTLTLTGTNTYSGGTNFDGGTVAVGADRALGAATGPLTFNGGALKFLAGFILAPTRAVSLQAGGGTIDTNGLNTMLSQAASGPGALTKAGAGVLTLTGANSYAGGTVIAGGALQLGAGGTSGSIKGNVTDDGALLFDRADELVFTGAISGSGAVAQFGTGTTVLDAADSYTGATNVAAGTLVVGDAGDPGAALSGGGPVSVAPETMLTGYGTVAGNVTNDGTLGAGNALAPLAGGPVGRFTLGGNLANDGVVDIVSSTRPGNILVVTGNYAAPGATLELATVLNAGGALSNQITDRLLVDGSASGTTTIHVTVSGAGAFTSTNAAANEDGISLVQVGGASTASAFTLAGGSVSGDTPFTYRLYAYGPGAADGPADAAQSLVGNAGQNWDYRLENVYVTPAGALAPAVGAVLPPRARPAVAPQVAAYISAPEALFEAGFEDVDELHRRLGEIRADDLAGESEPNQGFVRAFGSSFNYASTRDFAGYGYNMSGDETGVQFGATHRVVNDEDGTLRVGVAGTLGSIWYTPDAVDGASNGTLATQAIAGTATWQARSGWYVDGILSAGLFNGHVSTAAGRASGMNGSGVTGSVETGLPVALGASGLVAEPEAQLVYEHLAFADKTDEQGFLVSLGSPDEGLLRVGGRLLRTYPTSGTGALTPYAELNLLQGLGGSNQLRLSDVAFTTGGYGTAVQVRAGLTGRVSQQLSLYGDVARTQAVGDSGFRGWALNGGMKVSF